MTNESGLAMTLKMREQQLENALDVAARERGHVKELAAAMRELITRFKRSAIAGGTTEDFAESAVSSYRELLEKVRA